MDAGAHIIMLDNMPVDIMREAVAIIAGRASVEASIVCPFEMGHAGNRQDGLG